MRLIVIFLVAVLSFSACQKDPVDYSAYNAAQTAAKTAGTGGTTTGTGGTTTGTGGTTTGTGGTTTGTGTVTPSDYYFKGSLNGTPFSWQVTNNMTGWDYGSLSSTSESQGVETGSLEAYITSASNGQPQLAVNFEGYQLSSTQDKAAYFNNFLTVGTLPYAATAGTTKDVIIFYMDNNGISYYSAGPQTGSVFTIVSISQIAASAGNDISLKIKVTLNCTLYPTSGTGSNVILSNAEATINLENQL